MKRLVLILLIGIMAGYAFGYRDGFDGEPSWKERVLTRMGHSQVERIRSERRERDNAIDRAGRP